MHFTCKIEWVLLVVVSVTYVSILFMTLVSTLYTLQSLKSISLHVYGMLEFAHAPSGNGIAQ